MTRTCSLEWSWTTFAITDAWACRIDPGESVAKPTVWACAAQTHAAATAPARDRMVFNMLSSSKELSRYISRGMKRLSPKLAAARAAVVACTVALVFGCTTTVRTDPANLKIEPGAVAHLPARNVTLVNGHASETQLKFSTPPHTLIVEPKQMTDTAIEALRRALPPGGKGAPKRIVLRVHSPRQAGPYPTPGLLITLDADYG